jgi:ABC-type Zn uptake system ZnuABC Zn-binding protein ZnuA
MSGFKSIRFFCLALVIATAWVLSSGVWGTDRGRLSVAVTETDVEAIVKAVGGDQVDTFSLFTGCILRKDLMVESPVRARLAKSDAVVWTGYLNESAAINACLREAQGKADPKRSPLAWIDVSKDAARINVPTSVCGDYVDPSLQMGNPFFWLNPENGSVIARNAAEGLGDLRPDKRAYFVANASAFGAALTKDIARWKEELKPLASLRIFCTQCGWQNFSQIGGPSFVTCKGTPGVLPTPSALIEHLQEMRAQVVFLDPNTPPEYGKAFRREKGLKVIEVPSSIEFIPGARSYSALFDNLIKGLQEAAGR